MSVRFTRLRIAGFKSFAEPASFEIRPGLTGIVGPNGCGKSNVVEALRWAMGESSARSLRGGEMDDLIFAGTAARPARNLAEVTLTLEDAAGIAPPPFHDQPELEISRRIERGAGSNYRVNGREIRARDVQTLFADLASGARSSAMVSQGRVAAIVNARPEERRSILEEAAGITGLHARRHEAELKLRATEANLARAEDLRLQLESRLGELGAQSKQASRYREIAANLRESETGLLSLLHARARLAVRQAREFAAATDAALRAAERQALEATQAEPRAEAALAEPRETEAVARTNLERLRIAAEILAREEARAEADAAEARSRLGQSQADAGEAAARLADARTALTRIESDQAAAEDRGMTLPAQRMQAEQALQAAQAVLAEANTVLSQASADEMAVQSRMGRIMRDREAGELRRARIENQLAGVRHEHEAALRDLPAEDEVAALQLASDMAGAALDAARIEAEQAGEARITAARDADAAGAAAGEAQRVREAASHAAAVTTQRAAQLATELQAVEAACNEAAQALVQDAARIAAQEHTIQCDSGLSAARRTLEAAEAARALAQQAHAEARQHLAEAERRRQQLSAAWQAAETALSRAESHHDQLAQEAVAAETSLVPIAMLNAARLALAEAGSALLSAQGALAEADNAAVAAGLASTEAQHALAAAAAGQARIEAEADGLSRAIDSQVDPGSGGGWLSLAETLSVPPGLEAALAAILAEGLEATLDEAAPRHWRSLASFAADSLPQGSVPFSTLIKGPDALTRILSCAGMIERKADGDALQHDLLPGQCLVTRDGDLWRWDGYRLVAGVPGETAATRGAMALEQRNRLHAVRAELEQAVTRTSDLRSHAARAVHALARHAARASQARTQRDAAERELARARETASGLEARSGAARARLDAILPQHERAIQVRQEAIQALADAAAQRAALPELQTLKQALEQANSDEVVSQAGETSARQARQEAERTLETARKAEAALLARHGEAESRLEALLPQRARLTHDHATACTDARTTGHALAVLPVAELAQAAHARAMEAAGVAQSREADARAARLAAELERDRARTEHAEAIARLERQRSHIAALTPRLEALALERQEAVASLDALQDEAEAIPDPALAALATAAAQDALHQAREHEAALRETRAQLAAEATTLEATRDGLEAALADWSRREALALQGHEAALARLASDTASYQVLAEVPEQSGQRRLEHGLALAEAERVHAEARAALEAGAQALVQAQSARRQADMALSEAREAKVRLQGRAEQADAILAQLLTETPDPPQTIPDDLSESAETGLRRRIVRLSREREEMGPVNLRADIESQEAQARADAIAHEREELEAAIARLRGSIGHLNREGRERLLAVFEKVDAHFQSLFARMFNGGRAHLGMVGNDDPLLAGLEIYAQPPGKKLATLSLLSGGEQALTALSLIFAVFRCNPAPVCVLDEVDAPLDDANVGRFVALLADMVAEAGTRFLVVTHHQLTMAHMDRLYGVTMQERGVSRLLSVDLAAAAGMVVPRGESVS